MIQIQYFISVEILQFALSSISNKFVKNHFHSGKKFLSAFNDLASGQFETVISSVSKLGSKRVASLQTSSVPIV